MQSKVSIIIPLYNSEQSIRPAIESCINQTYQNIEIIVIDDGSSDNSKQKIEEYILSNKIKYFYQSNKERSAARNHGLDVATGDYINFLDSDDLLHHNKIEKQLRYLEQNHNFFATYSAVEYFDDETGKGISILGKGFKGQSITDDLVLGNYIPIQSVLFRRNNIRFDESINAVEDWDYFLNIFFGKNVYYINQVLSSVRRTDTHFSNRHYLKMKRGQIYLLRKLFKDARFKSRKRGILKVLVRSYLKYYALLLSSHNR